MLEIVEFKDVSKKLPSYGIFQTFRVMEFFKIAELWHFSKLPSYGISQSCRVILVSKVAELDEFSKVVEFERFLKIAELYYCQVWKKFSSYKLLFK